MNNPQSDDEDDFTEDFFGLPPMFGPIEDGERTWVSIGNVDYDLLGYVLSCHLIIEHYMDAYLKALYGRLAWDAAKLSFGQRVALLTTWNIEKPFNPIQEIKHLNSLRNRLGHQLDYRLTDEDMLPFAYFLKGVHEHSSPGSTWKPRAAKSTLAQFTNLVAAMFAGSVSYTDRRHVVRRQGAPEE